MNKCEKVLSLLDECSDEEYIRNDIQYMLRRLNDKKADKVKENTIKKKGGESV